MKMSEVLENLDFDLDDYTLDDLKAKVGECSEFFGAYRKVAISIRELYLNLGPILKVPQLTDRAHRVDRRLSDIEKILTLVASAIPSCQKVENFWEQATDRRVPFTSFARALEKSPHFRASLAAAEKAASVDRKIQEEDGSVRHDCYPLAGFSEIIPQESPFFESVEIYMNVDRDEYAASLYSLVSWLRGNYDQETYEASFPEE